MSLNLFQDIKKSLKIIFTEQTEKVDFFAQCLMLEHEGSFNSVLLGENHVTCSAGTRIVILTS
jgi:hypothetical protein